MSEIRRAVRRVMSGRLRHWLFIFFLVVLNVAVLEALSYAFTVHFLRYRGLVYVPLTPDKEAFAAYLADRDPVLGWPPPNRYGVGELDSLGARRNTFFPDVTARSCVSAYGNSFTKSAEVGVLDAWPNQLSRILGCRVNNFGVGGYGTDQALLRFYQNVFDRPPVAILAHASINITRNINEFGYLRTGSHPFHFKPRFVLAGDGNFVLKPIMDFTGLDYRDVYINPDKYFPDDYFLPNGPSGIPYARFPYTVSVVRAFLTTKFENYFDPGQTYVDDFYDLDHFTKAVQVTAFIMRRFHEEAIRRGGNPLLIIIPGAADMMTYEATGAWSYQSLLSYLEDDLGADVIDFGSALARHIEENDKEICDFYRREWYAKGGCTGHFNKQGYALLAREVAKKLYQLGFAEGREGL